MGRGVGASHFNFFWIVMTPSRPLFVPSDATYIELAGANNNEAAGEIGCTWDSNYPKSTSL